MSDKPVYQGSRNPSLSWKEITQEEFNQVSESISKGCTGLFVQVLYPASAYEALQNELETERMRLAACGVAALGNTKESVKERINKENPYYSASYADVCRAVDAEIKLRDEVERLKAENEAQAKRIAELEQIDDKQLQEILFIVTDGMANHNLPFCILDAINEVLKRSKNGDSK